MYWVFSLLSSFLFWPILLIVIFYFVRRKTKNPSQNKDQYLQLALSREDAISQWFFLLSVLFFGVTLLAFNRDFGNPYSWQTILLVTCIVGLVIAYYFKAVSALIFSLISSMAWWIAQAVLWGKEIKTASILLGAILIALLFYTLGRAHEKQLQSKRFSIVYLLLGMMFVTGALFIFSTKPGLSVLENMIKGDTFFSSMEMALSLFLLFIALLATTFYLASKNALHPGEVIAVLLLTSLFSITAFLPEQSMFIKKAIDSAYYSTNQLSSNGVLLAVIFNVVLFFELLGIIFLGYIRREEWFVNIGTFFLFLLIIVKYFDWFFTFLDKSIFFIGAGILLFAVGWFMEKGRRYVISEMHSEQKQGANQA